MMFPRLGARCAACLLVATFAGAAQSAGVFILDDGSPLTNAVSTALSNQGVEARRIGVDMLPSSPIRTDYAALWIAASSSFTRNSLLEEILQHMRNGGSFLAVGDPPFQKILYPEGGKWVSASNYLSKSVSPQAVVTFGQLDKAQAKLATDDHEQKHAIAMEKDASAGTPTEAAGVAAHITLPEVKGWATYEFPLTSPIPPGEVVTFWAKGTTVTAKLAIEWKEKDHSRWMAVVDLKPEWSFFTLTAADFTYWNSVTALPRGGDGDTVQFANGTSVAAGLAATHTRLGPGPHEFWIGDIGIGSVKNKEILKSLSYPSIDGLYPLTMTYPIKPKEATPHEAFAWATGGQKLEAPAEAWSSYWRPMGSGLNKKRRLRFIPVVTATNAEGGRAGTLAGITVHFGPPFTNAIYGYVSVKSPGLITSPAWSGVLAEMANRMNIRTLLSEAGSSEFAYDLRDLPGGNVRTSMRTLNFSPPKETSDKLTLRVEVKNGDQVVAKQDKIVDAIATSGLDVSAPVPKDANQKLVYRCELLSPEGKLLDVIRQEIRFDGPRKDPKFVTAKDRSFWRDGKPWRAFGVNYMPSSGCSLDNKAEFEYWIEDAAYDPEIVEHDLSIIESLGMNSISAFIYQRSLKSGNLLDLLSRARSHGLLVNLSLRPSRNPLPTTPETLKQMITELRLAEKDEICAYDIAWEPWWGGMERRVKNGEQWKQWVSTRYGSEDAAHKEWNFSPEKLEEFPSDKQLREDGPHLAAVVAYREFVQSFLEKEYSQARAAIREADPNHLVSFRQSEGGNPLIDPGTYPIEFRDVAQAVDFFSPEGYGIGDRDEAARTLLFAASYAEGLAPGKPMICAEFGKSVWSGNAFHPQSELYDHQADVYRRMFDNGQQARAAGFYAWWFPGGYRKYEESDYGIVNPDGTARPVQKVIREYADKLKSPPPPVKWEPELKTDAAIKDPRGYVAIYRALKDQFFAGVTPSSIPLIKRSDWKPAPQP